MYVVHPHFTTKKPTDAALPVGDILFHFQQPQCVGES